MGLRENLVICIGSPMIDITARVPYDFLQKYRLKPNNATSYNEDCYKIFHDLKGYEPTFTTGGSITHTVRCLQKLLEFPGACCYLGAIGIDNFGKKIFRDLKTEEINVLFEEIKGQSTGRCAVLLYEDNRSFVTDLGASKFLSDEFIDRNDVKNVIMQGRYYYISAFFLRISVKIIRKICSYAKAENKIFIFNIGAPFLCSHYGEEFKQILPYVNVLIGNEEESTQLAVTLGYHNSNGIKSIALFLHSQCYRPMSEESNETLVIITRADKSVILANKKGITEFEVPALMVSKKLNTCGAGDYFVGGFLANFVQNRPVRDCIHGGIRLSYKLIRKNSMC